MSPFRHAWRALARSPAYAVGATAVLAFAIALNAATFSVVDAILFRPLPYRDPDSLFGVQDIRRAASNEYLSADEARAVGTDARSFAEVAFYRAGTAARAALHPDGDDALAGYAVSPNLARVLGVAPALGTWLPGEGEAAGSGAVVIGEQAWRGRFGGAPDVIGRTLRIGGRPYTVVGVMPRGFWHPVEDAAFWIALGDEPAPVPAGDRALSGVARLRPGVSPSQAAAEVDALLARFDAGTPHDRVRRRAHVDPLREVGVPSDAALLYLLQGIVWCVVLVTCANVSNLVLVRTLARRRETAVQAALGASAWALAAPLLAEGAIIVGAASVLGVGGALLALRRLAAAASGALANLGVGTLAPRDVAAAVLAAATIVALCNAAPLLSVLRTDVNEVLKGGGPGAAGRPRSRRLRGVLLGAQVAASLVLLTTAAAMVRSAAGVLLWRPDVDARSLYAVDLTPARAGGGGADPRAGAVAERLARVPGVRTVAFSSGMGGATVAAADGAAQLPCDCRRVSHRALAAIGIPLRRGRDLAAADEAQGAAVIDERLARRLWGEADPVGRFVTVATAAGRQHVQVVGVAAHADLSPPSSADEPRAALYVAARLDDAPAATLLVRGDGGPALTSALRSALAEAAPGYPAHRLRSVGDAADALVAPMRWYVGLLGGLTAFALGLAALGLYAAVATAVRERRAEIAIRAALGAPRGALVRLVGGGAVRVTLAGGVVGVLGGAAVSAAVVSQVSGAAGVSPGTFAAVAAIFAATAGAAALVPAWRASGADAAAAIKGG